MREEQGIYYFHQGTNYYAYRLLGAHYTPAATTFRVWAPNATKVSVVGDFNNWDRLANPMTKISDGGIWEVIILGVNEYSNYQYTIKTCKNRWINKSDPYAFHSELRPNVASKVISLEGYTFNDEVWMKKRTAKVNKPMNIYELNLGSWRKYADNSFFDYRKLGDEVSQYAKDMGYTHIEIMPISEYPFDPSWGYQVTGFYSITSRYGTPNDFKYFVDICHRRGIGVIADWVPGHFCKDAHGLINFDGTNLYEPSDPEMAEHKSWGTCCFDYGRTEVQSFLVSNAIYLLEEFHIDGLRVDAVASMLYLDYGRENGNWTKNSYGGNINLATVAFLKKLNDAVHELCPNAIMIAEESTAYPKITGKTADDGLGFDYKWNMGWMNDTLSYMKTDPLFRIYEHHKITFQMTYIFSEHYILPLSHDEVVHGKASIINKMPGEYHQKFAGLKTYLMYMMSHPGKKLNFMGTEFGQFIEWRDDRELDWLLLQYETHRELQAFVKALNHFYKKNKPFYQLDDSWAGFRWLNADDKEHNVFVYERLDKQQNAIIVILNFAFVKWNNYHVSLPNGKYEVVFASNNEKLNQQYVVKNNDLIINLPEISGLYLRKVD